MTIDRESKETAEVIETDRGAIALLSSVVFSPDDPRDPLTVEEATPRGYPVLCRLPHRVDLAIGDDGRVMRGARHIGQIEEGVLHAERPLDERLGPPGVDADEEGEMALRVRVEGCLVDDRRPRDIHQDGVGLHPGELLLLPGWGMFGCRFRHTLIQGTVLGLL